MESITTIATGTGSALVISLVGLKVLWAEIQSYRAENKALSNSITHAFLKNAEAEVERAKAEQERARQEEKQTVALEMNTEVTKNLATKIDYIFRNGHTTNT